MLRYVLEGIGHGEGRMEEEKSEFRGPPIDIALCSFTFASWLGWRRPYHESEFRAGRTGAAEQVDTLVNDMHANTRPIGLTRVGLGVEVDVED